MVLRSENTWPATPDHVRDARREIAELSDAVAVGPLREGIGTEVHMTFRLPAPLPD